MQSQGAVQWRLGEPTDRRVCGLQESLHIKVLMLGALAEARVLVLSGKVLVLGALAAARVLVLVLSGKVLVLSACALAAARVLVLVLVLSAYAGCSG